MPCRFLGAAVDRDGHATYLLEYLAGDGSWVAARSDRFYASEAAARVIAKHVGPEDLRPAAENLENEIASGRLSYQVWVKAVLGHRITNPRILGSHHES
ncbi:MULTISPECIES: hypothetical protein [unclassified Chelatococcus]|uniref:hypothetical protein n=1 Tax=unclassified Chelatococcus TaxID=2638111 RepID=UPI001BCAED19|nr:MULTISPECIES: hypothetical protein [unclassified Chelatococcus]MBS7696240.1 hypothetical protein [Chelatococcus sp. YT9]MBX3560132.1 hypothetical protein [Chelatococcus sp.]